MTGDAPAGGRESVVVTVVDGDRHERIPVEVGSNLRETLLEAGVSPYTRVTRRVNCGGRGICATCGVRIADAPAPDHWHDDLADRFGYPRLSCRITVEDDLLVRIPDKVVWGGREPE